MRRSPCLPVKMKPGHVTPSPSTLLGVALLGVTLLATATVTLAPNSAQAKPAEVKVGGMMQLRYGYAPAVDDPSTGVDEGAGDPLNSFALRRGRIRLKASRHGFKLSGGFDFSKGEPRLLSLYLLAPLPLEFELRVGQTKRLLTQSYLASSTVQRMIERSPIGDQVGSNRDVGLRLRRRFFAKFVDVNLALFNGNGANTVENDTGGLLVEGRVDLHLLRRLDLTDATLGNKPAFVIGGAVARGPVRAQRSKSGVQLTRIDVSQAWSVHAGARWQGVELSAELLWHDLTPKDDRADQSTPLGIDATQEGGWSAQLAWQPPALQRRLEVSGRIVQWQDKRGDADSGIEELEACVGWRFDGDRLKLQTAWRRKTAHRAGGVSFSTNRLQLQLQAEM